MISGTSDLALTRLTNALALFDEFVQIHIKHPDAATLRGLEGRFAERLHIQPSYWSQIKGRSRQIGERLARQFEQLCHKPTGWMDQVHAPLGTASSPGGGPPARQGVACGAADDDATHALPQDDDERFIVGLVLSYYRRHPQRARTRLLDLLGEVLIPPPATPAVERKPPAAIEGAVDDGRDLWNKTQAAVAPLKRK